MPCYVENTIVCTNGGLEVDLDNKYTCSSVNNSFNVSNASNTKSRSNKGEFNSTESGENQSTSRTAIFRFHDNIENNDELTASSNAP